MPRKKRKYTKRSDYWIQTPDGSKKNLFPLNPRHKRRETSCVSKPAGLNFRVNDDDEMLRPDRYDRPFPSRSDSDRCWPYRRDVLAGKRSFSRSVPQNWCPSEC